MRLIINYYDPDNGEIVEAIELKLKNDNFDQGVANKFIEDFDRCEHGRHTKDTCVGCEKLHDQLTSRGNPGHRQTKHYDNLGNRIYAFTLGGVGGWVVVDDQLVVSLEV